MNEKNVSYGIAPSKIRELFEYGKKRKKEIGEDNVFDFSIGNPSSPVPIEVTNALTKLIQENQSLVHSYTSAIGDPLARKSIKEYIENTYQVQADENLIYLTCGAAAGLAITFNAILNEGDEAIVFAPYFPEYKVFINHAKGKIVEVKPSEDLLPDLSDLEAKINQKTAFVLYNSPNNPTGVLYKEEIIKDICRILERKQSEYHHPIYLISDEPYRELIYDDVKYPFIFKYYKNSIVTYSYSKSLSIPGERIGYIAVNPLMQNAQKLYYAIAGAGRSLGYISAPSLFQHLIPYINGIYADLKYYQNNRDYLYKMLKNIGYDVVYPDGAFYLFMKALEEDASKFSDIAKEYELLLVPSNSFGLDGYVRISYSVSLKTIKDSQQAFEKLYHRYK